MISRWTIVALGATALAGCAGRNARQAPAGSREGVTTVGTIRVDSTMPDGLARAIARADSATRAGARRLARVEVRPESLSVRVGARYPLGSLAVTFRDSAGLPIAGIVPLYGVSTPVARITSGFKLEGVKPGLTELRVRAMTSGGNPRPDIPPGIVRVTILP